MLVSKVNDIIQKISQSDKKVKIFAALGIIGIILIVFSEFTPPSAKPEKSEKEYDYSSYIASLEEKTENLVSSIDGAGECVVMITLKDTNESVFAKNIQENKSESSYSQSYEYVLYDGKEGETPVLVKQYFPQIQGVAVICDGADNTVVRENIINCISSLFNISVSKVSVSKIKG